MPHRRYELFLWDCGDDIYIFQSMRLVSFSLEGKSLVDPFQVVVEFRIAQSQCRSFVQIIINGWNCTVNRKYVNILSQICRSATSLTWPLNEPKRRQTSWPLVFEFIVRIIRANPYVIGDGQQKVQNQCNNWRPEPAVQQFNQASLKKKCKCVGTKIDKIYFVTTTTRHNKTQTHVPGTHTLNTSQKRMWPTKVLGKHLESCVCEKIF